MPASTLADEVIQRLSERVPQLQGRVEGVADLVQAMSTGAVPQSPLAAHVVADGLAGGTPDASAGFFSQPVDETVSVLLTFRNLTTPTGRGLDLYDQVKRAVIEAVCGWAPDDSDGAFYVGVFRLVRGRTIRNEGGTLIYQIDFAIGDQLRINVT